MAPVFKIPFAVINPVDVSVVVSIDELFNVVIVSLPWAVGYVKKNSSLLFQKLKNLLTLLGKNLD